MRYDVSDKDVRRNIKWAAAELDYPSRVIPSDRVDTHSYRGGGANALALAGYLDREIQKMGRWRGATVKRVHSRGAVLFFGRDVTQHEEAVSASSLWLEEHTTT